MRSAMMGGRCREVANRENFIEGDIAADGENEGGGVYLGEICLR